MKFLGTGVSNLAIDSPKHIASAVQSSVVLSLFSNHPREACLEIFISLPEFAAAFWCACIFVPNQITYSKAFELGPEHFLLYLLLIRADYFFCNTIVTEERESYGGV